MSARKGDRRLRRVVTIVASLVAVVIVARVIARADTAAVVQAMGGAGPLILLALAPFAIGMTIDACGTVVLLRALGHATTLTQMLPVRLASEALHVSIPAGFVASDTATAVLLEARCDVPLRDGVVASIARKWLVMRAHAGYIALGAVVGFPALAAMSRSLLHMAGLPWIVLASAAMPLVASIAVGAGLLGRSTFSKLHAALRRIPSRRLACWLDDRRHDALATDAQVRRLRSKRGATTAATLSALACWCFEALETALLLRLVGASVALPSVFAIEAGLSLVRSLVVIAPSGLGVVDLGYAAVLPALGADSGAAAAFVVLKRAKEVAWVAVGYAILAGLRGRAPSGVPATSPAA